MLLEHRRKGCRRAAPGTRRRRSTATLGRECWTGRTRGLKQAIMGIFRRPRRPESFYRSRREDFAAGVTIASGIVAGLLRGAQYWLLIVRGVRRLDPARGLWAFMWVVIKAALLGALYGYVVGWIVGFLWERWHRRRRARRTAV